MVFTPYCIREWSRWRKLVRICAILIICLISQGCISTQVSESTLSKYKGKHVREFLSEQIWYNLHNPDYNIFTRSGGGKYFLYTPALYVEEQVAAPSINVSNLCAINGGVVNVMPLRSATFIGSEQGVRDAFNDMGLYAYIKAYKAFRNSYLDFERQKVAYRFQSEKLREYINKKYFSDELSCSVGGKVIWSLSIVPVAIDKDSSDVDQVWILMDVKK